MKVLSVIIPTRNEQDAIQRVIRSIPVERLEKIGYKTDIIVVDNSEDDTALLASQSGAKVVHEPLRGYGRAYKTGFKHARGDVIATLDADMTYPASDIPELVELLENDGLDFITTNRFGYRENRSMSRMHAAGNGVLNFATNLAFGLKLSDSQSGMWIFRNNLLDRLALRSDTMAFSEEIKIEMCHFLGVRCREVPITYASRIGKAKLNTWRDGWGNLVFILSKRIKR